MRWRHTGVGLKAAGFLWLFALLTVIVSETPRRVLVAFGVLTASALIAQRVKRRRLGAPPLVHSRPAGQSIS